jgi:hypothetical protein
MWYKIDIKALALMLTPSFLRQPKHSAWLISFCKPMAKMMSDFVDFRDKAITGMQYRLSHNGQVCHLQGALNDAFDAQKRRISIDDGSKFLREYIYTQSMNRPRYLGKMHLQRASDYADTGVDFMVKVPIEIIMPNGQYNNNYYYNIPALIDEYKIAGKKYIIQYFQI